MSKWLEPETIKKTYGIVSHGGILSDTAASVDAYQMAHELIAFNVKRGMKVLTKPKLKAFKIKAQTRKSLRKKIIPSMLKNSFLHWF